MNKEITNIILENIIRERKRQDAKFGPSPRHLDSGAWLAILMEELGEVAKAVLEKDSQNYKEELFQLAACAVAALEDYYGGRPELYLGNHIGGVKYIEEQDLES